VIPDTQPELVGQATKSSPPFISVIVPVRNEEEHVADTLKQLLAQAYDPSAYEVIVVDGESTDRTRAVVRSLQALHPNLRLYRNPRKLSSAGRNIGVCHARGELLVIVDGHCDLRNSHYLRDLAEAFQRSGADCIGRPQPLDVSGATLRQRAIAAARSSWLGHHPRSWIYSSAEKFVPPQSVAVAYRRLVFEHIGLFDESFDACEDVDFNQRVADAGFTCYFTPKIRVYYQPRSTLTGLYHQMVRYARGRMRLLRKYPQTLSVACFIPMLFVLGLLAGPLLAYSSPLMGPLYHGALILYGLLVIAASCQSAVERRDAKLFLLLPFVFGTIHLGTGAGGIGELLACFVKGKPKFILKFLPRTRIAAPLPAADAEARVISPAETALKR
jgi:succinoglycan biosynthesis protein ExoA